MKQTVNFSSFVDAFHAYDRYEQFGYKALQAIFEHIESYEADTGEEQELDVIAICCEFATFPTALAAASEYGLKSCLNDDADEDDKENEALEYLLDSTTVIEFDGGIVVQLF